jgi:glycosyltransferase involved in cell wall biosynthesis
MASEYRLSELPLPSAASRVPEHVSVRVLLIAPYAPRGGGMGRIMAYLGEHGTASGATFEMVESRGGGPAIASAWFVLRAAVRIIRARVDCFPTIVHLNFGEGASVARKGFLLVLAAFLGMPTILHLHAADIFGFYARLPPLKQALLRAVFRRATLCIALGAMWRDWLVDEVAVQPSRVTVIRNGVPQPQVERPSVPRGGFNLVFLGNLLARKGLNDLLHALALLQSRNSPIALDWQFCAAGGGDTSALRHLADELGIAAHVRFLGWLDRDATSELLARANALALPSYHEALPLVLLEAASLGIPVIATRVGAIPEVFTDGHDALLVTPGDQLGIATAIRRLIGDPAFAARIGANGRRLYEQNFTMDSFVAGITGAYQRLGCAIG